MKRKLAELWEMESGDYELKVEVGAFQFGFTKNVGEAENFATYEIVEVMRKIVSEADSNKMRVISHQENQSEN